VKTEDVAHSRDVLSRHSHMWYWSRLDIQIHY